MDFSIFGLPDSIIEAVKRCPAEDYMLALLRKLHPDLTVLSLIPLRQDGSYAWPNGIDYFVLVRRAPSLTPSRDERFIDTAGISLQVFAKDPEADSKCALISEGIRATLRDASLDPASTYIPGLGSMAWLDYSQEAVRRTDWATATGPVQFADLPTGFMRYEARYTIGIRPDVWNKTT